MRDRGLTLAGLAAGIFFVAALYHLLMLRYAEGDAYPPASSFRTDPLGTRALHDALARTGDFAVTRNLAQLDGIAHGGDTTLLILGATTSEDSIRTLDALENFAGSGGRILAAFDDEWTPAYAGVRPEVGEIPPYMAMESIADRWGFAYGNAPLPEVPDGAAVAVDTAHRYALDTGLPETLPIHARLVLHPTAPEWRALYHRPGPPTAPHDPAWRRIYPESIGPVVIERAWGKGSIILAADTYWFTNEAMRADRSSMLMTRLIGPNAHIVFDEGHLGVLSRPGIVALARRYGLEGIALALIVAAGLFIWRNASSLVPRRDRMIALEAAAAGKGSQAALANLLRRSVATDRLIETCHAEWLKTRPAPAWAEGVRQIILSPPATGKKRPNPADIFVQIATYLRERKRTP